MFCVAITHCIHGSPLKEDLHEACRPAICREQSIFACVSNSICNASNVHLIVSARTQAHPLEQTDTSFSLMALPPKLLTFVRFLASPLCPNREVAADPCGAATRPLRGGGGGLASRPTHTPDRIGRFFLKPFTHKHFLAASAQPPRP